MTAAFLAAVALAVAATAEPAWAEPATQAPKAGASGPRPFDALLPRLAGAAPATYTVEGTALAPAPEGARIPVMVQADVLRGPERAARVGIVVGAEAPQAVDVRLRVLSGAPGAARVVADAGGSGSAGPMRLVREFSLVPGEYDLEALVGHARAGTGPVVAVARLHLTVPDIRGGSLTVTPVVAGETAKSAGTRQENTPFIFGPTTLTPAASPRFRQEGSVSVAFRIYNWKAEAGEKPDLTVEYLFYEQGKRGLHFFNKVKPQSLNAETLGAAFDPSAGSVAAGMLVPLGSFTFGEFRLLVRVTDNRSKQTGESEVRFTVAP